MISILLLLAFFGITYQILYLASFGFVVYGFWSTFIYTALFELAIEVTYPTNKILLSSFLVGVYFFFDFLSATAARFIMQKLGGAFTILLGNLVSSTVLFILYFVKPKYKRMEIDTKAAEEENQHLLDVN